MKMDSRIQDVIPWGRSFSDYNAMFALSKRDLKRRILCCHDGPAAFNSELTRQGGRVVSIDPLYQFPPKTVEKHIDAVRPEMIRSIREKRKGFVWREIQSPRALKQCCAQASNTFLTDYQAGRCEHRYLAGSLPHLPFRSKTFDLVLCSHFLFFYSDRLSLDFHLQSIYELRRVAGEVRIFPLVDIGNRPSRFTTPLSAYFESEFDVSIEKTGFEFQKGANKMLRIR